MQQMLRAVFTIFFSVLLITGFSQVDSMLQRMIEDAKNNPVKPAAPKKDSPVTGKNAAPLLHKDSAKPPVRTDSGIRKPLSDTVTTGVAAPIVAPAPTASKPAVQFDSSYRDTAIATTGTAFRDSGMTTVVIKPAIPWKLDTAFRSLLTIHIEGLKPLLIKKEGEYRRTENKDYLFYLLVGFVLLLAIIKQLFPRYLRNIFGMMFQVNYRQKQTREILMQDRFPSLLLNILFILVGGTFLALLAESWQNAGGWKLDVPFLTLLVYCITFLALIYIFKYLSILSLGWAFRVTETARLYNFIVFVINKVIGLALLPLLLLMAFSTGEMRNIAVTTAAVVVVILLLLRYGMSIIVLRKQLNINAIHFFIYLCAIEIMPLMILYKSLVNYLGKSNL